jgi:pimeloyl-ACP methyl ester carboxylesterase
MNILCEEVARIPQVACTVEDFHNASDIERRAAAAMAAGQRLVLVGHSMGGNMALRIAAAMKGSVALIVTVDASWLPTPVVPPNVDLVLNYYQGFDVLGRATLEAPPAFQGKLFQFRRNEPHVVIDRSPDIHAEVITRVRDILSSLNPPPLGHALPPSNVDRRSR